MALPVTIPNTFANATASIPLSQLDTNFNTLANAVNGISDGSETLANASVTVLTAGTVDINGGAIDGTTVGTSNAAAGSFTTLNTSGAVVFNDAGADVDFRVESDTDENALFVEGSSGNVGIGTSSPSGKLHVSDSSITNVALLERTVTGSGSVFLVSRSLATTTADMVDGYGATHAFCIQDTANVINPIGQIGAVRSGADNTGSLVFRTVSSGNVSESMRIDSSGNLLVGTTSVLNPGAVSAVTSLLNPNNDGKWALAIQNNATSATLGRGLGIRFATDYNNGANEVIYFTGASAARFIVYSNGNVLNTNNSYGQISDIKTKQDIVDAASQWDDIKNIRVRKFRFKNTPTGPLQIGVVAQEAEEVSPGLVEEHPDYEEVEVPVLDDEGNPVLDEEGNPQVTTERQATGTVTKSVKYSVLYMKAVKALQEAMERIETLEAKVAALENA